MEYFAQGDFAGPLEGEMIDTGADAGEGDGFESIFFGQLERSAVAGGEQLVFVFISTAPDGPDGVDDVSCGKIIALGDLGIARGAAAEGCTFNQ